MNGRIFILIAMTGLFVHIWNANDPAKRGKVAAEKTLRATPTLSAPVESAEEHTAVELSLDAAPTGPIEPIFAQSTEYSGGFTTDPALPAPVRPMRISESKTVQQPSVVPMWVEPRMLPESLPTGMACGLYQVVDNFGHVTLVQISRERLVDAGMNPDVPSKDMYLHQDGNQRWYFIRQGDSQEALHNPAAKNPDASLVGNPAQVEHSVEKMAMAASDCMLPLELMPSSLVRRQVEQDRALVAAQSTGPGQAIVPQPVVIAETLWSKASRRVTHLAQQAIVAWPVMAEWISLNAAPIEAEVLPTVTIPETEVELPAIPVLRTARPETPAPM